MTRLRGAGARAMLVLAACGLVLTLAPSAFAAKSVKIRFEYGLDRESWFWKHQRDEQVEPPVDAPPPAPSLNQRVRPNTQRPVPDDSLPVEAIRGDHEMISALAFDIASRGVTLGSEITDFVLSIQESTDNQEMRNIRADAAKIEACRITGSWPARYNDPRGSDGQEWNTAPEYDETACVLGKREAPPDTAPIWKFDLTEIAEPWGENPFDNQGVMLVSRFPKDAGPQETWHVQFKIPTRDRGNTPEDEYKMSLDRVLVTMSYEPGEPEVIVPLPPAVSPAGGVPAPVAPSTTFGGGGGFGGVGSGVSGQDTTGAPEPDSGATTVAATRPSGPRMPSYVWALLPVGLLALGAVRSVVVEPGGGTRSDGVIAAIRRRNLERRGTALRQPGPNPLAHALSVAGRGVGRGGRTVARAATKVTRRLRKG